MKNSNGVFVNSIPWTIGSSYLLTLPTEESSLNIYLNSEYYNSLTLESKNLIQKHYFNVGKLNGGSTDDLSINFAQ